MKSKTYPPGLYYLVFTEFWERFGYYLMIGIFFLYMTKGENTGAWGWENEKASDIYGTFIALAYLTPFMGGLLADLKWGYRRCIIIGGLLMGTGYCLLAVPQIGAFYTALAIMVIGNGFFKPNISTLLGNLFNTPEYKNQKDTGYNLFYMGINLGAFICNFVAAIMRNKIGWHGAFITAGVGMFIGVFTFIAGSRHYRHVDVPRKPSADDRSMLQQLFTVIASGFCFAVLGWSIPGNVMGSDSTDAFFLFCIPVIVFYARLYIKANDSERQPLGTMFTIFLVVILFWAIFKQNGTALTTYAEQYTSREIPETVSGLAKNLGFAETLKYTKDSVWAKDQFFRKLKHDGKPYKVLDYPDYYKNDTPKTVPQLNTQKQVWNTEIFQSINPFFVVLFTPLLIVFFNRLKLRGKEPTTATKIAYGLFISALSVLVMVFAVYYTDNGSTKASALWLITSYAVITIGELCLSPMGLSMVSKLAPVRYTALMMGGWQLATSIGNKLSGVLSKNWDLFTNKALYFWLNFALLMLAFTVLMVLLKRLNRAFKV